MPELPRKHLSEEDTYLNPKHSDKNAISNIGIYEKDALESE